MVQEIQRESSGFTLDVLKNQLRPRDAAETTPGGEEYVVSDTVAPNCPFRVSNPDVVSECGLSELPSSIHFNGLATQKGAVQCALYTLMTRLSMTPSWCRRAWRKWRMPSTLPH